jgi:hypothetical protein
MLGVKNTIVCVTRENRNHLPSLCMLHHTLYTLLFMIYTMPWNGKLLMPLWLSGNLVTVHSLKQYNAHTHTPHFTVYITQFTLQSIFLQAFLLMKTAVMWWYALPNQTYNHERLGENGRFHYISHHKWISKMRITCLL